MQYYGFQHIFDEYSKKQKATKAEEHDIKKIRDKFVEIIKLVGIDDKLLRQHKDEGTGEMVSFDNSNRQFCFPETICDFCVEIIMQYTSADFKKLRKAEYMDVSIKLLSSLIEGFTIYLTDLGYDSTTIAKEKYNMDIRLKYTLSLFSRGLYQECKNIVKNVAEFTSNEYLYYEDDVLLARYMLKTVKKCNEYIVSVYSTYEELRIADADNYAMEESHNYSNAEALTDISQSGLLADALEHDTEYQSLLKKQIALLNSPDFIKNLESSYNKNNKQIDDIKKKHIRELFGDAFLKTEPVSNFTPTSPSSLLYKAVKETDEVAKAKEYNISPIIEEQRKKQLEELPELFPYLLELPIPEQIEQNTEERCKIKFPCCSNEEITVSWGTAGYIICKCPRCGKRAQFNLNDLTAEIYETPKGHMDI